jgi:hypothetical protein
MKPNAADLAGASKVHEHPGLDRALLRDLPILLLSLAIQLVLGLLFGHIYDIRIFMAAGHQVAHFQNPYLPQDLSAVFHNPTFSGITTVGYPPPWPLMLGAIYALVYSTAPSFLIYNLAIKLPLIAANVALAYLTSACLRRLGVHESRVRRAWIFLLFNPFLLYASAAWGQFDSLVALLSLTSLMLLDRARWRASAFLLALAVSFKPTALPLILIPFFYLRTSAPRQILRFYAILALSGLVLCVGPFVLFRWDPSPILLNWNAHFVVGGGLTPWAGLELWQDSYRLPGSWWWVGMLWMPALALASVPLWRGITDLDDLLRKSTALIMVFFLTRAWLSEPNLILALPLVLILTETGAVPRHWLHAFWSMPLIFGVVNVSLAQLFFPSLPHMMDAFLAWMEQFHSARLLAKVILVVPWQILGWSIVARCLRRPGVA